MHTDSAVEMVDSMLQTFWLLKRQYLYEIK